MIEDFWHITFEYCLPQKTKLFKCYVNYFFFLDNIALVDITDQIFKKLSFLI